MPCKMVAFPVRNHSRHPVSYLGHNAVCSIQEVKLCKKNVKQKVLVCKMMAIVSDIKWRRFELHMANDRLVP